MASKVPPMPHVSKQASELSMQQCREVMDWMTARGRAMDQLVKMGWLEAGEAMRVLAPYLSRAREIKVRSSYLARQEQSHSTLH